MCLSIHQPEPEVTKTLDQIATEEIAAGLALQFLLARIRNRMFEDERIPVRGINVEEGEWLGWEAL